MLTAGDTVSGTYHYTYDGENRVATQTDPYNIVLTYGYNGDNQVTTVQDSLQGNVTKLYDALNNLSRVSFTKTGQSARFDLGHDANSNLPSVNRYGDTAGTQPEGTSTLTYDAENNNLTIVHKNAAN